MRLAAAMFATSANADPDKDGWTNLINSKDIGSCLSRPGRYLRVRPSAPANHVR
ncbi:MAG: hypothetical protein OSA84_09155 [Akkermansiaceae bacterium]|nr:hypothetical protein [Akkermansiaceae bacterium]